MNQDDLLHFVQELVRIPSLSGEESQVIERIASEMRYWDFDKVTIDKNGSLIGIIQGTKPGPTLLLDAHCDTVGVAPGVPWQFEPFAGSISNGRMYGRGTSDMKGALAAMIFAAAAVERSRLAGVLVISATIMEEVMEGISLKTVMEEVRPDFVVIGEATSLNINHGGRGRAEIQLEAIGQPAHSSTPHLGVNAVERMIPAIQAIQGMPLATDPLLGDGLMALTDIISDPYPGYSVIPSRCRVTYDRRLLAGESMSSVLNELRALPGLTGIQVTVAQGEHRTYTGTTLSGPKFFPAWKFSAEDPFVQLSRNGLQAAGLAADLNAYSFCTNGAYSAGQAGIPTIGFGPSHEGLAHITDEYIELDQLFAAARGYEGIIKAVLT